MFASPCSESLAVALHDDVLFSQPSSSTASPAEELRRLLSPALHSATSMASLHSAILQSLLRQTAKKLDCDILLTGESATRLATKCISGMACGRGFSLGEEMTSEWHVEVSPGQLLLISRPMSLLLSKELAFYLRIKSLDRKLVVSGAETMVEPRQAGIEALAQGQCFMLMRSPSRTS